MKILVIGAGSIGRRHIDNLNLLGYNTIDVVDIDKTRLTYVKKNFTIRNIFNDINDAPADYDAAFILTPPANHIEMAIQQAKKGTDLFIEKPLSHSAKNVDELIRIKENNDLIIAVGYNLRFNRGLTQLKSYVEKKSMGKIYYIRAEMGQFLPDWRPWQDYRQSYTARKELGGGIILDGSHEIDYVLWLVNSIPTDIKSVYEKVSDLEITTEDIAEIFFTFEGGIIASIHLNMIEKEYNRYCKIVGKKGSIKWIFRENILEVYDGESSTFTKEKYEYDPNHSYLEELDHFFSCIETRKEPLSNVYTAKETLETVIRIKGNKK
jgi:predicted dehydrogenase